MRISKVKTVLAVFSFVILIYDLRNVYQLRSQLVQEDLPSYSDLQYGFAGLVSNLIGRKITDVTISSSPQCTEGYSLLTLGYLPQIWCATDVPFQLSLKKWKSYYFCIKHVTDGDDDVNKCVGSDCPLTKIEFSSINLHEENATYKKIGPSYFLVLHREIDKPPITNITVSYGGLPCLSANEIAFETVKTPLKVLPNGCKRYGYLNEAETIDIQTFFGALEGNFAADEFWAALCYYSDRGETPLAYLSYSSKMRTSSSEVCRETAKVDQLFQVLKGIIEAVGKESYYNHLSLLAQTDEFYLDQQFKFAAIIYFTLVCTVSAARKNYFIAISGVIASMTILVLLFQSLNSIIGAVSATLSAMESYKIVASDYLKNDCFLDAGPQALLADYLRIVDILKELTKVFSFIRVSTITAFFLYPWAFFPSKSQRKIIAQGFLLKIRVFMKNRRRD